MNRYIGVKVIHAEPMNLGDYNKYKGWEIPDNEDPKREGFLVKYSDDYISWSPKEAFNDAYRPTNGMTFGLALEAVKKGKAITRTGWNGKGMHVMAERLYTPNNIQINNPCLLLFNVDRHYNTWVPSITDLFAEDWQITE